MKLGSSLHVGRAQRYINPVLNRKMTPNPTFSSFSGHSLSFCSLVFLFPWCFSCCKFPWFFWVFSAYFPGFFQGSQGKTNPWCFRGFLGISKRPTKRRTGFFPISGRGPFPNFSAPQAPPPPAPFRPIFGSFSVLFGSFLTPLFCRLLCGSFPTFGFGPVFHSITGGLFRNCRQALKLLSSLEGQRWRGAGSYQKFPKDRSTDMSSGVAIQNPLRRQNKPLYATLIRFFRNPYNRETPKTSGNQTKNN